VPLGTCPSSGKGAIDDPDAFCATVTPAATGADPAGVNADKPHYVLRPASGGDDFLVVFFNGSNGTPAIEIGDPAKNVYTAAVAVGHHVIGLSYRSNQSIGRTCGLKDDCFLPTRTTVVTGVYQPGAASILADILPSEGIEARLLLVLTSLEAADPAGNWGTFLSADGKSIDYAKIIPGGHSQGGGHAALLAKMHAVPRVAMFSSPCDSVGKTPASWEHADGSWATSMPDKGIALGTETIFDGGSAVGGDTTCPAHAAVWTALGLSPANQHDDAAVCAGGAAHGASIGCPQNFDGMKALFSLP
jgi:hypothetical protein